MNRFAGMLFVVALAFSMVWAQTPASTQAPASQSPATSAAPATPGAAATPNTAAPGQAASPVASAPAAAGAASNQLTSISGCMTEGFGHFMVDGTEVKGGNSLWNYNDHQVTVQGYRDPKSATPLIYVEKVETGQPCGNAAATNSASAAGQTGVAEQPTAGATATATPGSAPGTTGSATGATTGAVSGSANSSSTTGTMSSTSEGANGSTTTTTTTTSPGRQSSGTSSVMASPEAGQGQKGTPEAGSTTQQSNPPQQ